MDNVYFDKGCPAKMQDGRQFTDYHTNKFLDNFYLSSLSATSEHDYRRKLQSNGLNIIRENLELYLSKTCDCSGRSCTR